MGQILYYISPPGTVERVPIYREMSLEHCRKIKKMLNDVSLFKALDYTVEITECDQLSAKIIVFYIDSIALELKKNTA